MQRPNVGKLCSSPGIKSSNIQLVNNVGKASASCGLSFGDKEHSPHAHWPTHMLLVVSPSRKHMKKYSSHRHERPAQYMGTKSSQSH